MPSAAPRVDIAPPVGSTDLEAIRTLFAEYASSLGFSLDYQGFETELAGLPGDYDPVKGGALLLARAEGIPVGAVALRQLDGGVCEMKRLYVRPGHRGARTAEGQSIGRALAERVVAIAREKGYGRLRLDTIASKMQAAVRLYHSMGFANIPPYYKSPVPDTVFMELVL
jgi:putative acetyltransferase